MYRNKVEKSIIFMIFSIVLSSCKSSLTSTEAKGDGRTDDTAIFQRAINEKETVEIRLSPDKTYVLKDLKIVNKKKVVIDGQGAKIMLREQDVANNVIFVQDVAFFL